MTAVLRIHLLTGLSAALFSALLTTQAYAAAWHSIPDKSRLEFVASYEGAEALGQFSEFEVELICDQADGAPKSLQVDVDVSSASMGNADIDEAIAQPEWFDMKRFPNATFRSNRITAATGFGYQAEGVVSIKGVDRPLSIPFRWSGMAENGEMKGEVSLSRVDFDIGSGEWASDSSIGHDVLVRFTVTLKNEK